MAAARVAPVGRLGSRSASVAAPEMSPRRNCSISKSDNDAGVHGLAGGTLIEDEADWGAGEGERGEIGKLL